MAGFPARWCVAGGWAIELYLGRKTRDHTDLELAIFRNDQQLLHQHLRDWEFQKIVNGQLQLWPRGDWLELPIHEIVARSEKLREARVEFLLNEQTDNSWVFRRRPTISLPIDGAVNLSVDGIPFLAPEIVLLFKAKSPKPKDELDFCATCLELDETRKKWLRSNLEAMHVSHPWIERLA